MKDRKLKRKDVNIYEDQIDGLLKLEKREGITPSESIRRAIDDWLEKKGVRPQQSAKLKGGRKNDE